MLGVAVLGLAACTGSEPVPPSSGAAATPSGSDWSPAPPTGAPPACSSSGVLAAWPTARLAAQVLVSPVLADDLASVRPDVEAGIGGIVLFGRQVPDDLAVRLADLRSAAPGGIPPLVSADEEGGAIQRLAGVVGPVPAARALAATRSPAEVRALAARVGRRMAAAGVGVDLAPVADLDGGPGPSADDPDGTRSFGTDPRRVSAYVVAFASGLRSAHVAAVVKHFPGLGGASGNTDLRAATTRPWSVLQQSDLQPFAAAVQAGVPAVMLTDASVPGLSALPASLSPDVVSVLRGRLGFDGVVMTDSLSATAVSAAGYTVPEAAVAALAAGADSVLYGRDEAVPALTAAVVRAVVAAVAAGRLARDRLVEAAGRVLTLKGVDLCAARP